MPFILRLSDVARHNKERTAQLLLLIGCFMAMFIMLANAGHAQSVSESEFSDAKRDIAVNASRTDDLKARVGALEDREVQVERVAALAASHQTKLEDDMEYLKTMLRVVVTGIIGIAGKFLVDIAKWFLNKANGKGLVTVP